MRVVVATVTEPFKSLSPAEFFYTNREIAGFSNPARALYQTVRELVENALDATDTHGILPLIKLMINCSEEHENVYTVVVEDNGIGIPPQYIPQAFAQVLFSSKYRLRQSRGMFGLGAKMAILYGQITTGKPVEVYSSPINSNRVYYFKLSIDIKRNRPVILEQGSWRKSSGWHGTIVSVTIVGDWPRSRSKIYEYIRRTAIAAPYAEILFKDPDGRIAYFPRVTSKLPAPPREVKPHPHGIDIEMMKTLMATSGDRTLVEFLVESFQGIGPKTAKDFLEFAGFRPDERLHSLTGEKVELLVKKMHEYRKFKPPRTDALSPLGVEIIKAGLARILNPEFVEAVTRRPSSYSGHPFIVEVGIAYGGSIQPQDEPVLLRFANKIPLLYDEKSDVAWKVIDPKNFDWKQYMVEFPAPLVLLVHICSTKIPYKGVGKESVAEVQEIESEVRNGVREVCRMLKTYLLSKEREEEIKRKILTYVKYIPEVARGLSILSRDPLHGGTDGLPPQKIAMMLLNIASVKSRRSPEELATLIKHVSLE